MRLTSRNTSTGRCINGPACPTCDPSLTLASAIFLSPAVMFMFAEEGPSSGFLWQRDFFVALGIVSEGRRWKRRGEPPEVLLHEERRAESGRKLEWR